VKYMLSTGNLLLSICAKKTVSHTRFAYVRIDTLAAGTAIGHLGEWKQFVDYLKTSYNAGQLGQVR
jgi:hypothetical protein